MSARSCIHPPAPPCNLICRGLLSALSSMQLVARFLDDSVCWDSLHKRTLKRSANPGRSSSPPSSLHAVKEVDVEAAAPSEPQGRELPSDCFRLQQLEATVVQMSTGVSQRLDKTETAM